METHAIAWLVKQYRCVLGRMRMHEFREAHPILPSMIAGAAAARPAFRPLLKLERLEDRVMLALNPITVPSPLSNAADVITISGTPSAIAVDGDGAFADQTVTQQTPLLVINAADGGDTINFNLSDWNTNILVDGGPGTDTLSVAGRTTPTTIVRLTDGSAVLTDGVRSARVVNVENFAGAASTVTQAGMPAWLEQGPAAISGGQVLLPPNNPVSGAINAVLPHPFDPNMLFVGSVSGGVWRNGDRTVFFDTASSALSADAQAVLNDYAAFLLKNPGLTAQVVGHTDSVGDPGTNATLSLTRATAVRDHLLAQGVPSDQLGAAQGLGETQLIAPEVGGESPVNRRVELLTNHWEPLTEQFASLSIGDVRLSRFDNAGNPVTAATPLGDLVLYAGTGGFSSARRGGPSIGLLKSTDGGDSWALLGAKELAGFPISSVVATGISTVTGEVILVSTMSERDAGGNVIRPGGIFRSVDGGATFSKRLDGDVTDMVSDPGDADRFYAGLVGTGVMVSDGSDGLNWAVSAGAISLFGDGVDDGGAAGDDAAEDVKLAARIILAVEDDPTNANNTVYAGVIVGSNARRIVSSPAGGTNWTNFGVGLPALGGQADIHFTLEASRDNAVYVGGAARATSPFVGNIFRATAGTAWVPVTVAGAGNTAPHADTRDFAFDLAGRLLTGDDGGVTRLTLPDDAAKRRWSSVNGNLRITETGSVGFDPLNNVFFSGNQDNGTTTQAGQPAVPADLDGDGIPDDFATRFNWNVVTATFAPGFGFSPSQMLGDGSTQLAIQTAPNRVMRFSVGNNYGTFIARTFNELGVDVTPASAGANPNVVNAAGSPMTDLGGFARPDGSVGLRANAAGAIDSGLEQTDRAFAAGGDFVPVQYVANAVNNTRMITGVFSLYESFDNLETITPLISSTIGATPTFGFGDFYTALAYGGRKSGVDKPTIIYAARGNQLSVRTDTAATTQTFETHSVPGAGVISSIVLDPADWETAYVSDGIKIWKTTDHGANWAVVSQKLPSPEIRSLEMVDTGGGNKVLLAGTALGVFRAANPVADVKWVEFGLGLPNAVANSVEFVDRAGSSDVLVVGTQGRGVWTMYGDIAALLAQASTVTVDGTPGADNFVIRRSAANPLLVEILANSTDPIATLPITAIDGIVVNGGDGNDTLTVDSTNGGLVFANGIVFHGQGQATAAGDTLVLTGGSVSNTTAGSAPAGTITSDDLASDAKQTVTFDGIETLNNSLPLAALAAQLGDGLEDFLDWLNQTAAQPAGPAGQPDLALLGLSLLHAILGFPAGNAPPASTPGAPAPPRLSRLFQGLNIQGFRRLIETGSNAFRLDDANAFTLANLEDALDNLDAVDGNTHIVESGGVTTVTLGLSKQLKGSADLEVLGSVLGGNISLDGSFAMGALLGVNLKFGFDSSGFFIDTASSGSEITINHLTLTGGGTASGRFGFLDVEATVDSLAIDEQVGLKIDLIGGPKLRLSDLAGGLAGKVDIDATTDAAATDISLVLNAKASAIVPGVNPFGLGTAKVTLAWADVTAPSTLTIAATAGLGQDLINFLKVDVAGVFSQIKEVKKLADGLGVELPFISDALSSVVDFIDLVESKVITPLTASAGGTANFKSIQNLAMKLAQSLSVTPAQLGLTFDNVTKQITFNLALSRTFLDKAVTLGGDVNIAGPLGGLEFSTTATADADAELDVTFGIDLGAVVAGKTPDKWFFIKNPTASATISLTAEHAAAAARFGFLGIEIFEGTLTANATTTVSFDDPTPADGYITIADLLAGIAAPTEFVNLGLTGTAHADLPIRAPFLGINGTTPNADNTLVVHLPDISDVSTATVTVPAAIKDVANFGRIDAAGLVGLLGQMTGWLDEFRRSDDFANFDIPLVGPALDKVLGFADAFRDKLLIDDNDTGVDNDKTLLFDVNAALEDAGLGGKIRAEKTADNKIKFVALDPKIAKFTVTDAGGLGFASPAASSGSATDVYEFVTAGSAVPVTGILGADVAFKITIQGQPAVDVTVEAADTTANEKIGDDKWKLVNAQNAPTFATVDELVLKLTEVFGIPGLAYNAADKTLTFTLGIGSVATPEKFGQVDLPVKFNFDGLAPLVALSSNSVIRLTADGSLTMTVGVYLGDAPSSVPLGEQTLADLGVGVGTEKVITAPQAPRTIVGQLSDDAHFSVSVNDGAPVAVTVTQAATNANTTTEDLVADINAALPASLSGKIQAVADGRRVVLRAIDAAVTKFRLTSTNGDTAVKDIGFAASQNAVDDAGTLKVRASKDLAQLVGRLTANASFAVSLDNVNGGTPLTINVSAAGTAGNRYAQDLINDINAQFNRATHPAWFYQSGEDPTTHAPIYSPRVQVGYSGGRLTFTAKGGATNITISALTGVAGAEMGIAAGSGNSIDFYITDRAGTKHGITLDGLTDVNAVLAAIGSQTVGKVTASLNAANNGIKLTNHAAGTGTFGVTPANGTSAANDLGLLIPDAGEGETPDGVINGGSIGEMRLTDRFFLQNVNASVGLHLTTPEAGTGDGDGDTNDGLNATAQFGFLGIGLHGGGAINAVLSMGLKDPGTVANDGRISLTELIDGLDDLSTIVLTPTLTGGGAITLGVSVTPALPGLAVSPGNIVLNISDLGEVFGGALPSVNLTFPDSLVSFTEPTFNFQNIIAALKSLAGFLDDFEAFGFLNEPLPLVNISVNELMTLADKFAAAVDEAQANPAATVQFLERKLEQAFGLPANSPLIDLKLVHDNNGTPEASDDFDLLKVEISLGASFSESLSVDFDLGAGLSLGGAAALGASGTVALDLDLGIRIDTPTDVYVYDTTGLSGTLNLSGTDLTFRAAVGPLGVFVTGGTATIGGTLAGPPKTLFNASLDDADFTNGRVLVTDAAFDLGGAFTADLGAAVHVDLPLYFPTDSVRAGTLLFDATIEYDEATDGLKLTGTPVAKNAAGDVVSIGSLFTLDPSKLSVLDGLLLGVDGVDLFLEGLQDVLDGDVFGFELPLIGDKLAGAADVIGDFREGFIDDFRDALESLANPSAAFAAAGSGVNPVSKMLFDLLGPAGLGLLLDGPDAGSDVGQGDIVLATNINVPGVAADDLFFDWDFKIGGTIANVGAGIGFDLGIPGLGLETSGAVNVAVDWEFAFGFGVNADDGFYLDIGDNSELQIDAIVTVPGGTITGRLGFLQLTATDDATDGDGLYTHLAASFGVNVINRSDESDTKLGFAELGRLGIRAGLAAEAVVDLGAELSLNSDLVPGAATNFPKLVADFSLIWGVGNFDEAGGNHTYVSLGSLGGGFLEDGLQYVGFEHVGLDLGSYFSDLILPIVQKVQEITEPIKPFLDFLTTPIPVISDLAGPTTLLDIAEISGALNPGLIAAIEVIDQVIDIAHQMAAVPGGNLVLYFDNLFPDGKFAIYDADAAPAGGLPDLSKLNVDLSGLLSNLDWLPAELQDAIGDVAEEAQEALAAMLPGGGASTGFSLPIIEDPSQIFGMLLGKPAVLVQYDMAPLELDAEFSAFFSIFGPLGVSINAEFSVLIDFSFGYDTRGIQDFAASDFRNPALLFNGFFVNDMDAAGDNDVSELVFNAGLWAAAELNLGIARGGVGGGLFAEIDFNLHDPDGDGRVRISEIAANVLNEIDFGNPLLSPLAVFDVAGSLTAELFAFLKLNLGLVKINKKFLITPPLELLNFNVPFTRVPTLATELDGGVLQLNMGQFAGQRIEGDKTDGNETFVVKQAEAGKVFVWSTLVDFDKDGLYDESEAQKYDVSSRIIALGGEGNDVIDLSGVTGNYQFELEGNAGDDVIKAGSGNGASRIYGGAGNDHLDGGAGADTIFGEAGDDVITGGEGADRLFGDGDANGSVQGTTITVGVKLSDGADSVQGGGGDDLIFGSGGADLLEGGEGADLVIGDQGTVTLGGVAAVKDTDGTKGGADTVRGDAGADRLYGGFGGDTVQGGADSDAIFGDSGADAIDGGDGADTIDGGTENDVVNAGLGNDTVFGRAGNDVINGNEGSDWMEGGTGFDVMHGNVGNDFVFGNSDPDYLYGDEGNDFLEGAGGNDTAEGGLGSDTLVGGYGSDKLDGQADGDSYLITARGGSTIELTTAYDTGSTGTDIMTVLGTSAGDTFLLRAMADFYFPKLAQLHSVLEKIFNSERPDKLELMKQAVTNTYGPHDAPAGMIAALEAAFGPNLAPIQAAITGTYVAEAIDTNTAFVALLNDGGTKVERFNYRSMEGLVLNTVGGDDYVVFDDVIAATTVNLGTGNDRVQVGQVFNSLRDDNAATANVAADDAFATVAITRGFLSNGVSVATVINGGDGNDEFTVFHNLAVLNLNGGDGDDLFTIRAFALAGSTDSERGRTDMKGDGGADTILYVLNAPVGIDGGDGFDTVRIIGTEFADDFVVTDAGVFGAGLNVNYVNIEKLVADGAEGDDRFFVLSTGIEVVTELDGGLGSDSFFVGGNPSNAPIPVISNDFKGHSGVILHSIESGDPAYLGKTVDGVSANVADDEESFFIVTPSGGNSVVTEDATAGGEGWVFDTYTIRLTRSPAPGAVVRVAVVAAGLSPEDKAKGFADLEFWNGSAWVRAQDLSELVFTTANWAAGQEVKFRAISDTASEGTRFTFVNHTTFNSTDPAYAEAKLLSVKVQINDDDRAGVIITPSGTGTVVLEGGTTDTFDVVLTSQPTADVRVYLSTANGQLVLSKNYVDFTPANWNVRQVVTVTASDDAVVEGLHTDFISYTVQSADADALQTQASYLVDGNFDLPGDQAIPTEKATSFLFLRHKPALDNDVTITLDGAAVAKYTGQTDNVLRYQITGNTLTFVKNGNATAVSGAVEASYKFVREGYDAAVVRDSVVDVYDNDVADVIVTQSAGSTDLAEGGSGDTYTIVLTKAPTSNVVVKVDAVNTRTTLDGDARFEEQVEVSLDGSTWGSFVTVTFTPGNWGAPVTIHVRAKHDTYRDGSDTQVFAPQAQTVNKIRGPLILEGAAGAGSLSLPAPLVLPGELNIKPSDGNVVAFEDGAGGGVTEFMTVNTDDLLAKVADLNALIGKTIELTQGPGTGVVLDPTQPRNLFDRFWLITGVQNLGNGHTKLMLQNPTMVDPGQANVTAPTAATQFAVTNLSINFFADEKLQVDYTFVYDDDSVGDDTGALTSADGNVLAFESVNATTDRMTVETADLLALGLAGNDVDALVGKQIGITVGAGLGRLWTITGVADGSVAGAKVITLAKVSGAGLPTIRSEFRVEGGDTKGRITGFGMGPNVVIGDRVQPGGITYGDMEVLEVNLGSGNDTVTVDYTSHSADHTTKREDQFHTLTVLNTGGGNDTVNVRLTEGEDGAFSLNAQAGDDTVDASPSTLGLVIFGWDGNDTITGGSGRDTLFGDRGRVDYVNEAGTIVTRLGHALPLNPVNPPVTGATDNTLTDSAAAYEPGSLVGLVVQAISNLGHVQFRTITGNTATTITISGEWDEVPDSTFFYRVATLPEDQTDGTLRGARAVHTVDNAVGGNDVINGGAGDDLILGGAGGDAVSAGAGADKVAGDDARFDFTPVSGGDGLTKLVSMTTFATAGNDSISGNEGDDLIVAGMGDDAAHGDEGADVVAGDTATVTYQADGVNIATVEATDVATGGADILTGDAGNDLVIGGLGNDVVRGNDGADVIVGDEAVVTFAGNGVGLSVVTTTDAAGTGGNDNITGDAGDDMIVGGLGNDTARGGDGVDVLLGDAAAVTYGGDGVTAARLETTDRGNGGADSMYGDTGDDLLAGGTGADEIDGGAGKDLALGDNATLVRHPGSADMVAPRYRTLTGGAIYDADGRPVVGGPVSGLAGLPAWADWTATLDHTAANSGNDYMAGGAGDDQLFGQLGNDTIQGDGSIDLVVSAAEPSVEAASDGDDYVEGNGGDDVIFGNLGQDDLVGGSADMYSYTTPQLRDDGSDTIFGGAGTRTARNDAGLPADGAEHARDADFIVGDNGNIYRLVDASGAARTFTYDNYGALKLLPRAVQHLDYTYGGNSVTDVGAGDLLHGEGGDDSVYGTVGNDVLFGGGQDDDVYGGTGHDRIYAGTGEDGVVGDDGLILTSRNGLTETLHNVDAVNAESNIALPGPFTGAWIFITGRLNKTVDILAWGSGGNDVIYGGLGDDFLHGGAGDDGISGAEATADFYNTAPVSDTNPLGYNPATRKLAAYDAANPLAKIAGFFLNFDASDPANQKIEDGKDRVFGDLGNDWLVGGTGNDRLFGGAGDDVHNADDNHETAGGMNNQPDAVLYADRDFVYGGDGLDVLIANTGGDRMFDWGGEFNSFIVPYSPFGEPTVVRKPSPAVVEFIRALGMESGADRTVTEPDGELGLFTHSDPQWQANHGGPRDPQPGNSKARRDTQGAPEDDRGTGLPLSGATGTIAAAPSAATTNSFDVSVATVTVSQDPSNPSQMALFVGGTNGNDTIELRRGATASLISVVVNSVVKGSFARGSGASAVGRVIVYGNDGNDIITVNADLGPIETAIYGGAGNDRITGGSGNNYMDGGDGDDVVTGGTGHDVMIGGLGKDVLSGDRGNDILVAGQYTDSDDLSAALAIMNAWGQVTVSYAARVASLKQGVGPDGFYAMNTSRIVNDTSTDVLNGNLDQDWFLGTPTSTSDDKGNEIWN